VAGGVFQKHALGSSKVQHKAVWCSEDLLHIYWGDLNRKSTGTVKASDIERIELGCHTKAFENSKNTPNGNRCFSLLCRGRSLDLECVSQSERDLWALAFNYLFTLQGSQDKLNAAVQSRSMQFEDLSPQVLVSQVETLTKQLQTANEHIHQLEKALKTIDVSYLFIYAFVVVVVVVVVGTHVCLYFASFMTCTNLIPTTPCVAI
jgi:hypothetical protein